MASPAPEDPGEGAQEVDLPVQGYREHLRVKAFLAVEHRVLELGAEVFVDQLVS